MKLIGVTANFDVVDIVLADCPSYVSRYNLAHLGREKSPLIRINSIVYYDEDNDLCEGDYVLKDGKEIGVAYYTEGWKLHEPGGCDKKLSEVDHICMRACKRNYDVFKSIYEIEGRSPIKVCANGEEMLFDSMLMVKGSEIIFNGKAKPVLREEIFLSTGIYDDEDIALRFGGYFDGGVVCIDADFDLAVRMPNGEVNKI